MTDPATKAGTVDVLKAVAHPLRFDILSSLSEGEMNVGEIEKASGIGQPTLSQQLAVLRKAGLVKARREAKLVFYTIDPAAIGQAITALSGIAGDKVSSHRDEGLRGLGGAAVFARTD